MTTRRQRGYLLLLCHVCFVCAFIKAPLSGSGIRLALTAVARKKNQPVATSKSTTNTEEFDAMSISYSQNFWRHVVRSSDGSIVKSYAWLDDAMEAYPNAHLKPIAVVATDETSINKAFIVPGTTPNCTYGNEKLILNRKTNAASVRRILRSLGLDTKVINSLPKGVFTTPCDDLEERIRFYISPLSNEIEVSTSRTQVAMKDRDWVLELERDGYGAGLSAEQLAYMIPRLPYHLLLPSGARDMKMTEIATLVGNLHQNVPSLVLDMTSRQLDPFIDGALPLDYKVFSYIHWRGWSWASSRVILQALPSIVSANLEPSWQVVHRNKKMLPKLEHGALEVLQWRLQLRPWHIRAIVKTHPAIINYSKRFLESRVEDLRALLGLRSSNIQRVVLRHPSVLGMSKEAMQARIQFWRNKIGLDHSQLEDAFVKEPALLQYSIADNLEQKLKYFTRTWQLDRNCLARLTVLRPRIWGRSLQRHYIPFTQAICDRLLITQEELGQIISKAPELLLCSWRGNICVKLDYLESRLNLQPHELKEMVQNSPKILMHGVQSSLEQKISLLEKTSLELSQSDDTRLALVTNPSLLLVSNQYFRQRLEKVANLTAAKLPNSKADSTTILKELGRPARTTGKTRTLRLVPFSGNDPDDKEVGKTFSTVVEAAKFCAMSTSHMYRVIRLGLKVEVDGRKFRLEYADRNLTMNIHETSTNASSALNERERAVVDFSDYRHNSTALLIISTTGRSFPSDNSVRGRRRGGGLALQMQLSGSGTDASFWRATANYMYSKQPFKVFETADSVFVLLGYQHLRPSRPRCSLYAVREALRLAREWVKVSPSVEHEVIVRTDSESYVAYLLQEGDLAAWGTATDINMFTTQYNGPTEHAYQANPDILYPLARSYCHLSRYNVKIKFEAWSSHGQLMRGALRAAKRMYRAV
ncbi:hypothetical protein MPSEU_000477300 [Mayamaea pseudoterrestris]|nr:hypothetical protein MPSEU_000477300 [Mayamaea pseudoterrestris]